MIFIGQGKKSTRMNWPEFMQCQKYWGTTAGVSPPLSGVRNGRRVKGQAGGEGRGGTCPNQERLWARLVVLAGFHDPKALWVPRELSVRK